MKHKELMESLLGEGVNDEGIVFKVPKGKEKSICNYLEQFDSVDLDKVEATTNNDGTIFVIPKKGEKVKDIKRYVKYVEIMFKAEEIDRVTYTDYRNNKY